MSELTDVTCPKCGEDSIAALATMKTMYTTRTVSHVDGGEVEFLETWRRFYCGSCGETFAVRSEETELERREE